MKTMVAKYGFPLLLAFAAPAALAEIMPPDALLRMVTLDVITIVKQDVEMQAGDAAKISALVEIRVLPLFDILYMTQTAMARNWHLASPQQKLALTMEFRTLLIRTYSAALANYSDEVIVFKHLHTAPGDTDAMVRSEVRHPGGERMSLDYDMEKTPEGWKVHDVRVAGIRMVSTYRDAFAEAIHHGGVDGLIKTLGEGNRLDGSRFNGVDVTFWEKSRVMYAILQGMLRRGR